MPRDVGNLTDGILIRDIFIYGSLKPGEKYAHIAREAGRHNRREGFIDGFALYHLEPEGYPAIVPDASGGRVYGWLLLYPEVDRALALLDDFEGLQDTPPPYTREQVTVYLREQCSSTETAWVYVYARLERLQQPGALHVPSGRWTGSAFTRK